MTRLEEIKDTLAVYTVRDTWMITDLAWAVGEIDRLRTALLRIAKEATEEAAK